MTIALRQSNQGSALGNHVTLTLPSQVLGGSLVVFSLATTGASGAPTITAGQPWQSIGNTQLWDAAQYDLRKTDMYWANTPTGSLSVSVSWPVSCYYAWVIQEFTGASQTAPFDIQVGSQGLSSQAATSGGTTHTANEVWYCSVATRNNDVILNTPNTESYTQVANPHSGGTNDSTKVSLSTYYVVKSGTGTLSATKSINVPSGTNRNWLIKAGSFAESATTTKSNTVRCNPTFHVHPTLTGGTPVGTPGGGAPSTVPPDLVPAGGVLWAGGGSGNLKYKLASSSDGTSWSTLALSQQPAVAMAGSPTHLWLWQQAPNVQALFKCTTTSAGIGGKLFAMTTESRAPLGMAWMGGKLYRWTGANLQQYNTAVDDADLPLTTFKGGKRVYNSGLDPDTISGGDIVATDNSVAFFVSTEGDTRVYEYAERVDTDSSGTPLPSGAATPIWTPARGFTAVAMCYLRGSLFLLGDYLGRLTLMGFSPQRQEFFPGYLRPDLTLTGRCLASGFGNTVLVGAYDSTYNYVWSYNLDTDSFHLIQRVTRASVGDIGALLTFKNRRFGLFDSSSTVKTIYWSDDLVADTSATGVVELGAWDFDIPEQDKTLIGFNVVHSPLTAGKSFSVDYQINESGSYVTGATQSGGAGAATSTFVAISTSSSTVKFRQLRLRINFTNCQIYSVSSRAVLPGYYRTWELVLRLKKEGMPRPSNRAWSAEKARDLIFTAAVNKNVVAFTDGYAHEKPSDATSHTVTIEDVQDVITRNHEGSLRVKLRDVSAT